ncbi:STAS domain-containing protein [Phytohabitans sp. ZYX-F-186]|uniref:STAS domain-containing protein n=1 Tax=Phytohabitans maris TaxID=3071409 RepID=A0ABU0ZMK6_9ACTN|nr:STAS domain-containing protein [Phytohabitans sp. ZYX-F-186]MDQ7907614.1 STAS domain-containing protein [Phytohabitans sp. ZYX-F-186]
MSTPALAEQPLRPGRVPLVEVVITEPIDAQSAPHVRALLDEALALRPEHLVVDLAGCPSIDASGVAALLETHRQAMRDGGRLSLRAPSVGVHRNLRLARVANVLHIVLPEVTLPAEEWSAAAGSGALVDPRPAR